MCSSRPSRKVNVTPAIAACGAANSEFDAWGSSPETRGRLSEPNESDRNPPLRGGFWRVVVFGRRPLLTLLRLFIWAALLVSISKYVIMPVKVVGISMMPTYKENRVNFINRLAYVFGQPRRGDVVAIRMAGEHVMLLKRIIALPGETVGFHAGRAVVDERVLPEPYLAWPSDWERKPVKLGPNEFFVVGDNRSMPQADHDFGRAERRRLIGRAML